MVIDRCIAGARECFRQVVLKLEDSVMVRSCAKDILFLKIERTMWSNGQNAGVHLLNEHVQFLTAVPAWRIFCSSVDSKHHTSLVHEVVIWISEINLVPENASDRKCEVLDPSGNKSSMPCLYVGMP